MGGPPHARPMTARDAVDVYDIYAQGLADRTATFETAPPDPADLAGWPRTGSCVVVERDETVEREGRSWPGSGPRADPGRAASRAASRRYPVPAAPRGPGSLLVGDDRE